MRIDAAGNCLAYAATNPQLHWRTLRQKRVARATMLLASGLHDMAEDELKFGSQNEEGQSNVYAFELGKFASGHGAPDEALRYIGDVCPRLPLHAFRSGAAGVLAISVPLSFPRRH